MNKKVSILEATAIGTRGKASAAARPAALSYAMVRAEPMDLALAGGQKPNRRGGTRDRREDAHDRRGNAGDQREDAVDRRDIGTDWREEPIDSWDDAADRREEIVDRRDDAADRREEFIDRRQDRIDRREDAVTLREKVVRAQETTGKVALGLSGAETQLREANERLVIAAVHAQTMTETAEQTAVQMSFMAEHDILTGLSNRAVLTDRLAQAIAFAQRHGKKVALMYLDLDHFKEVNDSLGHAVGDLLLQSVAKRLQACVRISDTLSRQGGDEFVVLLPEVETVREVIVTAEKLIKAMVRPHLIGGHQIHLTLSVGISLYPDDGKDAETTIKNADNAMYHAKKWGRDNFQIFNIEMDTKAVERQSTKAALHRALEQREFVLHYQPAVNLKTGAITGAEALLRLQPTDFPLVYPEKFMSVAQECGLMLPIGAWVLREACRQTQAWRRTGLEPGHIAVNVSANELRSKDFLPDVRAVLRDTGLDPSHLELELTEKALTEDTASTAAILQGLRNLGVRIAIDDFGTGRFGLTYLRRFPVDTLKIDQSFVRDIDGNGGDAIASAVISMGISLDHRIVAKGIETRKQLTFLKSHHCGEGQGHYFSRPVVAKKFASMLEVNRC